MWFINIYVVENMGGGGLVSVFNSDFIYFNIEDMNNM